MWKNLKYKSSTLAIENTPQYKDDTDDTQTQDG